MTRSSAIVVLFIAACALAACGGGGGGGNTGSLPPNISGNPSPTSTATSSPTPTATPSPTPVPTVAALLITGKMVDAGANAGISGITVAAAPATSAFTAAMAGSSASASANIATATTASDGTFTITCGSTLTVGGTNYCSVKNFYFAAYGGAAYGNNSFHGQFASTNTYGQGGSGLNVGTIKLTDPSAEEIANVAHVNAFRAAPGPGNLYGGSYGGSSATYPQLSSNASYGVSNTLVMDENLIETAKYWAGEMHTAGRLGHTCAAIGNPTGCIEQSAFYAALPGEPSSATVDGNAATGYFSWAGTGGTWPNSSAQSAFEVEGDNYYGAGECPTVWDAPTCVGGDPPGGAGHFISEMAASQWIGLGEVEGAGASSAFMEELR